MKNRILYYKGQVFEDMPDPYLKGNKEAIDHIIIVLKIMLRNLLDDIAF